jgi:hypothetical protein
MLGKGRLRIAGILRLLFAHHGDQLDPTKDHAGTGDGLKAEHRPDAPFDGSMILLNPIIQVGALSDPNWLQFASRLLLGLTRRITGQDRFAVGLATIDHNSGSEQELMGLPTF